MLLSISFFMAVSVCLKYQGVLMLGTWIFIIVTSSLWIDPLIFMLSLVTVFILKSVLSNMNIAIPAFFHFHFRGMNTFFHPLTLNLHLSLDLK